MLDSQKYSNIFKNTYSINEKVLINENFKIYNKTLKKINKNFGQWNITAEIIKVYSTNSYKVKICDDFENILKKGDEYYTNITMIKKVNDDVWKAINQENQNRLRKHIENV